jgi:predicted Zn-dependent protease
MDHMSVQNEPPRSAPHRFRRSSRELSAGGLAVLASVLIAIAQPVRAQEGLPLLRDTETENLLRDYARPIFRAAGLGAQNISMRLIRHESFNAFVADGQNVFVNSGLLSISKTPNEVIGVIAHETGHIKGGHLAQLRSRIARDQTKVLLINLLGIGAMVAGGLSRNDSAREIGGAGQGVLLGGNDLVMRSLLGERRAQESAADQAGLQYLNATGQSGRGMLETFERFAQQEYVSDQHRDPFVRSHPVAADRLAQLRERVARSPYADKKDPPELQARHDMVRAKISGYLDRPGIVLNKYPQSDRSLPARYARAIAANCSGRCLQAPAEVDQLLKEHPQNPFFWELRGSLSHYQGKPRDAVPYYRKALQLLNNQAPLVEVALAQSMLATEDPSLLEEAINLLRRAVIADKENANAYQQLSVALFRRGQQPQAMLASAKSKLLLGNFKEAQVMATRARAGLPTGSPEAIQAEDIINFKPPTTN